MNPLRLTLAGAALAAALPALAASGSATTAAPAGSDPVVTQPAQSAPMPAQSAPMKVALATPAAGATRATPRSLTDAPARKYSIEQAAPNKPYRLEHAPWTHDEDHAY